MFVLNFHGQNNSYKKIIRTLVPSIVWLQLHISCLLLVISWHQLSKWSNCITHEGSKKMHYNTSFNMSTLRVWKVNISSINSYTFLTLRMTRRKWWHMTYYFFHKSITLKIKNVNYPLDIYPKKDFFFFTC